MAFNTHRFFILIIEKKNNQTTIEAIAISSFVPSIFYMKNVNERKKNVASQH